jgi:hypothetical protein
LVAISYKCGSNVISTGVNLGAVVRIIQPLKGAWRGPPLKPYQTGGREGRYWRFSEEPAIARGLETLKRLRCQFGLHFLWAQPAAGKSFVDRREYWGFFCIRNKCLITD